VTGESPAVERRERLDKIIGRNLHAPGKLAPRQRFDQQLDHQTPAEGASVGEAPEEICVRQVVEAPADLWRRARESSVR